MLIAGSGGEKINMNNNGVGDKLRAPLSNKMYIDNRYIEGATPVPVGANSRALGFSKDGNRMAVMNRDLGAKPVARELVIFDVATRKKVKTIEASNCVPASDKDLIYCLKFPE